MSARDEIMRALHSRDGHALKHTRGELSDAILSALDKAGYAVVPKEPTEALRWSVVKHVPETELSADDLYRSFIRAVTAAKETP